MDVLDNIILSANQNKEYKYEDYKKEEAEAVEVTTISLKDSGSAIKNPITIMGSGGGSGDGSTDMLQARVDTANSCDYLFYYYRGDNADFIKKLDTSGITSAKSMFESSSITRTPVFDTSNIKRFDNMYRYCHYLTTVIAHNFANAERLANMFEGSSELITYMPALYTGNVSEFGSIFSQCKALETIEFIDFANRIDDYGNGYEFNQCINLKNLTVVNIKTTLQIGSGTTWGHLLTLESLLNTIKELVNVGRAKRLTMGSANLDKLANVYVKLTGEAEEDESNPKMPFVVCESTDEGAMTIEDYAGLKNWTFA